MQLWGDDFTHSNAQQTFSLMKNLFEGFNKKENENKFKVQMSTPGKFFKKLYDENETFSVRDKGDFFPYKEFDAHWWTGYFTTYE